MGCLRDALVAALTLDTFNRHADKVDMANIAQLVNNLHSLFLADGDRFVATPNFHVFAMYRPHQGAKSVRIDGRGGRRELPGRGPRRADLPRRRLGVGRGQGADADAGSHPRRGAGRGRDPAPRRLGRRGSTRRS